MKFALDDQWIKKGSKKRGYQDNRIGSLKPLFHLERRWQKVFVKSIKGNDLLKLSPFLFP
jgi:hypothetical protein